MGGGGDSLAVMRLHDTRSGTLTTLQPRDEGKVGLYVCGPTVYDDPHLGHARAALVPDVLRRYLQWRGLDVLHVRNITDVDDKIIERAAHEGRHVAEVAETYTRRYEEMLAALRVLPPHIAPRATGHLLQMHDLIEALVDAGHAYTTPAGPVSDASDVWFAVRSFSRYGSLSHRDVDELRAGARVEADARKRDPLDFALWKSAKEGEPSWPSPWGPGRPGWHIECSAMAAAYLGHDFDIHMGGADLVFPHHENEIAQSEAASGRRFARLWVHNGLLDLGGEKMSKSLGNVVGWADVVGARGSDATRFFFLQTHYRSPIAFAPERLDDAANALQRLRTFVRVGGDGDGVRDVGPSGEADDLRDRFVEAMDDDLSTPRAHAVLFDTVAAGNRHLEAGRMQEVAPLAALVVELAAVLGYELRAPVSGGGDDGLVRDLVADLLHLRAAARDRRDFATADGIRSRLADHGVTVEDRADGPTWHRTGS